MVPNTLLDFFNDGSFNMYKKRRARGEKSALFIGQYYLFKHDRTPQRESIDENMCSYVLYSALTIKTTVFLSVNLFLHECYTDVFNQLTDI